MSENENKQNQQPNKAAQKSRRRPMHRPAAKQQPGAPVQQPVPKELAPQQPQKQNQRRRRKPQPQPQQGQPQKQPQQAQPQKQPVLAKEPGAPAAQSQQQKQRRRGRPRKSSVLQQPLPELSRVLPTPVVVPAAPKYNLADDAPTQGSRPNGTPRLRVIPLGGMNEIGKNMTVFEYGNDIIVIDCGMTFPDDELLGVDLVIPDVTYLTRNKDRVRGIFLTHAHEDHIGALPYVLRDLNVPIYCTALTAGIISLRLKEHRDLQKTKIHIRKDGDKVKLGCFEVEFIRVNHSVADSCAFAIKTPVGVCVVTGDFKIDTTPISGGMINLERFGQLGRAGVLLLMMDSTNAERPGMAMSERKVGDSFEREFKSCDKRIIVASFASNVYRIQQILDVSARHGRKVAVSGRSMENILKVGVELGYINPPANTLVELNDINKYPKNQMTLITTGSQGEPMSALYRMAFSGHRQVEVGPGDKILIAASPIPGNEKPVYTMINELFRKGAEVVYERLADIHVSGHACQEELKMILALVQPKFFLPAHGEYRHLIVNAGLGRACGVPPENIFISDLGRVLELDQTSARFNGTAPSGRVLVDGYGVGNVGNAVLRERRSLSDCGVIAAVAGIDLKEKTVTSGPEIVSRGFVFVREAEEIMDELKALTNETLLSCMQKNMSRSAIKEALAKRLSDHLYKKTKLEPVIMPVLLDL